jgi:hypothetical protein
MKSGIKITDEFAGIKTSLNVESFCNSEDSGSKVTEDSDANVGNSCAPQQSCVTGRTDDKNSASFTMNADNRTRLTAKMGHEVALRDQAQCTHLMPNGSRCRNRRWLHIHHIKEIACGGGNAIENLTTLCSGHHRMHHHMH